MARKAIPKKVKQEINNYLTTLKKDKLPIEKALLFGSYATGKQHKWSDIDLCIVSPQFKDSWDGFTYLILKREIHDVRYAIEPHGFNPRDFNDKYSSLAQEIKKTGIEIKV